MATEWITRKVVLVGSPGTRRAISCMECGMWGSGRKTK